MRIGIITINDSRNLGNGLQNFVIKETIRKLDSKSSIETILNTIKENAAKH